MARIRIEALVRTEEELSAAEEGKVVGAGPFYYGYSSPFGYFNPGYGVVQPVGIYSTAPTAFGPGYTSFGGGTTVIGGGYYGGFGAPTFMGAGFNTRIW